MHALKLNRRALDSLHALRMEPFLRLISTSSPSYDPRTKSIHFSYTASDIAFRLTMAGHQSLAIALRDHLVSTITLRYSGDYIVPTATGTNAAGDQCQVDLQAIAPGIGVALVEKLLPDIEQAVNKADRYVRAFAKLAFCSPELLLNASRNGITYRVRTDTPKVDEALLEALDKAMSRTNAIVLVLRVVRIDVTGTKDEHILPVKVVDRAQPLRPFAINAIQSFFQPPAATSQPFPPRGTSCPPPSPQRMR